MNAARASPLRTWWGQILIKQGHTIGTLSFSPGMNTSFEVKNRTTCLNLGREARLFYKDRMGIAVRIFPKISFDLINKMLLPSMEFFPDRFSIVGKRSMLPRVTAVR